jgi:integrase
MPKKRKKEKIAERYFTWLLGRRQDVYYADGRSNDPPVGRHSLGTKDYDEAREALKQLDVVQAVQAGRADKAELGTEGPAPLSLEDGWDLYRKHVSRPRVTGGAKPASVKRYRPVFDKFISFARREGVTSWNRVTTRLLERYAAWLDGEAYAFRTEYLELTALKQAINWLKDAKHLPDTVSVHLSLTKPTGTDTYCWTTQEVNTIVAHCLANNPLHWLADVVTALASTGVRISELASLRWTDVDLTANVIRLTDETTRAPGRSRGKRRETKNSRSRTFPISDELRSVLQRMKPSGEGTIFRGPRNGVLKPDTVRTILIRNVLTPLSEKFPSTTNDLSFADGRLHSFRHYFCSRCANNGVPELAVMTWLGHRSSEMVRHYYHLHDAEAQQQMKQVKFVENAGDMVSPGT